ncbi:DUF6445 family protein [Congregibacter sp.]|uniref:DUF6445 family protein n=1 Tax=Congregibacter sp. TaxID=2744308 RepID=UPI003F6D2255
MVDIVPVGRENTPVVVIDDLLLSIDSLRDNAALKASFQLDERFAYPGRRALLPLSYGDCIKPLLDQLLLDVYGVPRGLRSSLVHAFYSLITLKPEELQKLQRVPHFDTHDPFYFATVHYLGPQLGLEKHSGTGIFRHKPTGYERISRERFPEFVQAANQHMHVHGAPPQSYINGNTDHFELIAAFDNRPNRMILYPGNLLHSGLIDPDVDIDANPASGRLTANLFLHVTDAAASDPRRT